MTTITKTKVGFTLSTHCVPVNTTALEVYEKELDLDLDSSHDVLVNTSGDKLLYELLDFEIDTDIDNNLVHVYYHCSTYLDDVDTGENIDNLSIKFNAHTLMNKHHILLDKSDNNTKSILLSAMYTDVINFEYAEC